MTGNVLPILRSVLVQRYTQIKQSLSIQLGSPDLAGDTLHAHIDGVGELTVTYVEPSGAS